MSIAAKDLAISLVEGKSAIPISQRVFTNLLKGNMDDVGLQHPQSPDEVIVTHNLFGSTLQVPVRRGDPLYNKQRQEATLAAAEKPLEPHGVVSNPCNYTGAPGHLLYIPTALGVVVNPDGSSYADEIVEMRGGVQGICPACHRVAIRSPLYDDIWYVMDRGSSEENLRYAREFTHLRYM